MSLLCEKKIQNWKSKLSLIQNSSKYVQSIPKRINSRYTVQQHYSRPFDTILLVLTLYYSSESTKQLGTFHLPFGGDENVPAKWHAPWPNFYLYATFSRLSRKPTNIYTGFFLFHSKLSVRTNHLTHHQLNDTSVTSTPHTCINAHRPWACRGMPFDDVCPLSQQGAPTFSRWPEIFFSSKSLPLGEGPRMASSSAWLPAKSGTKKHDLKIGPSEFAHFLHAALESIYKNKVLLTFCPKNIFCWPKITFFMPKWPFFHIFQLWELISCSQVPGAVRTWTAILLSVVSGVRGQILVQIGLKLGEI